MASLAVLFQELALIRWLPTRVRVVAYFPNLILLSAFLGIGIGCLRSRGRDLRLAWPVSLAVLVGAAILLSRIAFTANSATEHLWLLYYDLGSSAPVVNGIEAPIVACFVLCAVSFIPLGQLVARRLDAFRDSGRPLTGYGWDLLGSMLGVIGFAVASFLRSFPAWWFAALALLGVIFFVDQRRALVLYACAMAAVVAGVALTEKAQLYSPYYGLRADQQTPYDIAISVNGSLHQKALAVGSPLPATGRLEMVRAGYHVPYRDLGRKPRRVLVLGAGTGNDVAVALGEGAASIDAVEIDPAILELGRRLHPDHPYASPRVHAYNTDARSFLNGDHGKYDLIVFGTLDSMTRLSALSAVRLDNFVYTEEGLRAARDALTPDGGMVLYFLISADHLHLRILRMVSDVFGEVPRVHLESRQMFNAIYLAGPGFPLQAADKALAAANLARLAPVQPATDDWPYLYLNGRGLNSFYASLIAILGGLSVLAVALASRELRGSMLALRDVDAEMFLLGSAFLLLETGSVTEMTLVWGVTWLTNAVVFGAILLTALLGTLLQGKVSLPWPASVLGVAVALIAGYLLPTSALATPSIAIRLALSVLFIGAPIFFAATLFASAFAARKESGLPFGWNLLGAVAGGLLEFTSMVVGIKALHLMALALYLAVALVRARSVARTA